MGIWDYEKLKRKQQKAILPHEVADQMKSLVVLNKRLEEAKKKNQSAHHYDYIPFHPLHTIKELNAALITVIGLLTLSIFLPHHMVGGLPADPAVTPAEEAPPWYFLSFFQIMRDLGNITVIDPSIWRKAGIFFAPVFFIFVMFVPFIDRNKEIDWRKTRLRTGISLLIIALFVVTALKGYGFAIY